MSTQHIAVTLDEHYWEAIASILQPTCSSWSTDWIQWAASVNQVILDAMRSTVTSSSKVQITVALTEENWESIIYVLNAGTRSRDDSWIQWVNDVTAAIQSSIKKSTKPIIFLLVVGSLLLLSLPPVIWMFITQRFTIEMFIESIAYLVQFSSMIIASLLPFHIPSESQENGTVYLLNLIPLVLLGVPAFLIYWRQVGVKKAIYATWIIIVGIVFLMELAALVVMELFSHVGP